MKWARFAAILFLVVLASACLLTDCIAPAPYAQQFRDLPDAAPTRQHLLGTDALGRDRFSRLLYGTRVSLLLAPAAALLSSLLAALIGGVGICGRLAESLCNGRDGPSSLVALALFADYRASVDATERRAAGFVAITFALLGCLGWAAAARVICADAREDWPTPIWCCWHERRAAAAFVCCGITSCPI